MLKEFREFILRGNLDRPRGGGGHRHRLRGGHRRAVSDLVTPLIAAIGGEPDFSALSFTINGSEFLYGHFINALLTFTIVAAVIFFLVIKPVNALMARARTEPATDEPTRTCPECLSDIPEAARRCAFCTAQVATV